MATYRSSHVPSKEDEHNKQATFGEVWVNSSAKFSYGFLQIDNQQGFAYIRSERTQDIV